MQGQVNAKKWIGICKLEIWIRIEKHRGGVIYSTSPTAGLTVSRAVPTPLVYVLGVKT